MVFLEICVIIEPDATLLEYSLLYSSIYIILAILIGAICLIILNLRHKSKKVENFRYNFSRKLFLSIFN